MKILPGVATGDQVQEIFNHAKKHSYALPAVNVTSSSTVNSVMEAAANFVGEAIPIINRDTNIVVSVITEGAIFEAYLKVQDTVIDMEKR